MRHVITTLVQNQPGVLAHVAGMFAARGFNIDSLVVGRTEDAALSRMTIVVVGDEAVLEQVRKQLGKVVPVVKIRDFLNAECVERDLMLIRVSISPERRQRRPTYKERRNSSRSCPMEFRSCRSVTSYRQTRP